MLSSEAAAVLRLEIESAGGNEVCFIARLDAGAIHDPRVVARGNATATLAAMRGEAAGGMVLHNHPSGVLSPSSADLAAAAALWEEGLGFAIVDNAAAELYVVVEPPAVTPPAERSDSAGTGYRGRTCSSPRPAGRSSPDMPPAPARPPRG
ncbi:hypothetical protein BH20GEM2_BH20GEM2_12280 [soil metagenome]